MSLTRDDARQILGVGPRASDSEIEDAYREKAKKHHPDVSDDPEATETFLKIKKAKEMLLSSEPRSQTQRTTHSSSRKSAAQKSTASGSRRTTSNNSRTGTTQSTRSSSTRGEHQTSESNWRSETQSKTNKTSHTSTGRGGRSQTTASTSTPSSRASKTTSSSSTASASSTPSQSYRERIAQALSWLSLRSSVNSTPTESLKAAILSLLALNYLTKAKEVICHPVDQWRKANHDMREARGYDSLLKVLIALFFEPFIYRQAPGFERPFPHLTPIHQFSVLLSNFHLRAKSVLTNGVSRVGVLSSLAGAFPIIALDIFLELTPVDAALGVGLITTAYLGFTISAEETGRLPEDWSVPTSVYSGQSQPWSVWGSIIGLAIAGIIYGVFPTIVTVATIGALPIMLLYSLPLCWVTHPIQKRLIGIGTELPKWSNRFNLLNLSMSMVLVSILVHTPLTFAVSPIAVLDSSATYSANFWDGFLASILAIPWLFVLAAGLDILEIGWYRNHVEWNHSSLARVFWTSVVSSGLGIIFWTIYTMPSQITIKGLAETAFIWGGAVLFVYGLTTEA